MSLNLIILDSQAPFATHDAPESRSLLLLPLGYGSVLATLLRWLRRLDADSVTIAPDFEAGPDYEGAVREVAGAGTLVGGRDWLRHQVSEAEPSDVFLMIDGRLAAADDYATAKTFARRASHERVRHLLARPSWNQAAAELVQLARDGSVERIRRYYEGVTRAGGGSVVATAVSAAVLQACSSCDFASLAQFRLSLAARGISSEDVDSESPAFDLSSEDGFLALHEREVRRVVQQPPPEHFRRFALDIYVEEDATVDASATLFGPVIVQRGARIGPGAYVIGPTVLGRKSRVGNAAVVAQSVLTAGSDVGDGRTVRQQLWCARRAETRGRAEPGRTSQCDQVDWNETPLRRQRWLLGAKRAADAILAAVGLLLLSPVFAVVAVAIRFTSRGPVLFGHEREGRRGRSFRCWKFRTMVKDAHAQQRALYAQNRVDGPQFKLARDPRVTSIGAWLRSTNLDELPQLINVLLGDMSLIGPRPSPFRENQICVPWRQARLSVRPGITGLWQLCRTRRAEGDFHQWIYYDLLYARHLSWKLDAKILAATVLTLGGRWTVPVRWLIPSHDLHESMTETSARRPWRSRFRHSQTQAAT